jgi:hypothetical protein
MIHPGRALPIGVFLGVAALVATRAIDLIAQGVWTLLVVTGVGPQIGVGLAITIHVAVMGLALVAKFALLMMIVRRPERMAWLYRTWAAAIVLAVIELLAIPAQTWMAAVQTMTIMRVEPLHVMGDWYYWSALARTALNWAHWGVIAGVLLWAYARTRGPVEPIEA